MSVVKIKSEGLRLGGRPKVTAVRVLSVLRKRDGEARGLVARELWHRTGTEITYSHRTRVDSKNSWFILVEVLWL